MKARRVTKAYDVLDTQDVLRKMHLERSSVTSVYISVRGYIMVVFTSGPVRCAGRLSTEVHDWLDGSTVLVNSWNVSGGETFKHESKEPRLFGLNLCIVPQDDAHSTTEAPSGPAPEG